ncbi:hypothetical protein D9M72_526340 [compost metagenome]
MWVVPKDFDWFRVQLPMIVTGFGKTSDLPGDPAELMELLDHQPLIGKMARSGAIVDAVLHPRFKWPHETPRHQWETIQRLEVERAEVAEAARVKAAQEVKARQLVGQEEVQRNAERDSLFAVQAVAPDVGAVPAVTRPQLLTEESSDIVPALVSHPVPAPGRNPVLRTVLFRPPIPSTGCAWKTGRGRRSVSRAMTPSRKPEPPGPSQGHRKRRPPHLNRGYSRDTSRFRGPHGRKREDKSDLSLHTGISIILQ